MSNKCKREILTALGRLGNDLVRETVELRRQKRSATTTTPTPPATTAAAGDNSSSPTVTTAAAVPTTATSPSADTPMEKAYIKEVVMCAVDKFVKGLPSELRRSAAQSLGLEPEQLEAGNLDLDVDVIVNSAADELLVGYAKKLSLETDVSAEVMRKNIADEVMLVGMDCFLTELSADLLASYCGKLGISYSAGMNAKQLAELLMVDIFQLDPSPVVVVSSATTATASHKKQQAPAVTSTSKHVTAVGASTKKKGSAAAAASVVSTSPASTRKNPQRNKQKRAYDSDTDTEDGSPATDVVAPPPPPPTATTTATAAPKKKKSVAVTLTPVVVSGGDIPRGYYDSNHKWVSPPISAIVKGRYTKQTLHDNFCTADLQHFCSLHDLPCASMNKTKMISMIVKFVDEGIVPTKTKKSKKQQPSSTATTTTTSAPSSEPTAATSTEAAVESSEPK